MAIELKKIRYSYSSGEFSSRAIAHVFRYISALTGMEFTEDLRYPEIFRDQGTIAEKAKVVFGKYPEDGRDSIEPKYLALENDPIDEILRLITLETKLGPYRDKTEAESKTSEPALSVLAGKLIDALAEVGLAPSGARISDFWPNGKRFGAIVTHDIDIARRSILGSLRLLFKKEPPGHITGLLDTFRWKAREASNPYDRIPDWIKIEKELGLVSTYFVFAGRRHHRNDPKYKLKDLSERLNMIGESGSEIALHTGIECHDGRFLTESKQALEDCIRLPVGGTRPHYLSADLPSYWRKAAEAGFSYSSCLGFDDDIGHLRGIDLPFFPFDKANDMPIDLVEIPLAIMDCGLIGHLSANSEEVIAKGKSLIDRTAERGGLVVLDWHQRTLYDPDYPGWGKLYLELTRYMMEKDAYFGTMTGIASLLRERAGIRN